MADVDLRVKAQAEGFPETQAQVAALETQVSAANKATAAQADTALTGEAAVRAWADGVHAAATANKGLAEAEAAAATGATLFSRAMTALAGPLGILITVLVLILTHLKDLGEWFGRVGAKLDDWIHGVGQGTQVLDAHGKVVEALDPKYKKLAEAQDLHARALQQERAGLIAATEDMKRLDAEALVHEANFRKAAASSEELVAAFKTLGIVIPDTFESLQKSGQEFLSRYQIILDTEGPAAARVFAEANKRLVDDVISRYIKMGEAIPPELKKVETVLGDLSKAEADAAKDKGLADRYQRDLRRMADESTALLVKVANLGDEFLKTRDKIEQSAAAEIAASEAKTRKTLEGLQEEVKQTEEAHAARLISDTEYNAKVNGLFAEMAKARTAGFDQEKKIKDDEKTLLDKAVQERDDAGKKIIDKLEDVNVKQTEVTEKLGALTIKLQEQRTAADLAAAGFTGLSAQFGTLTSEGPALAAIVAGLTGQFDNLARAARDAAAAVASVTDGGGGEFTPTVPPVL